MDKLDERHQMLLCELADPEAVALAPKQLEFFEPESLFTIADYHGIGPVVARKICPLAEHLGEQWENPCRKAQDGLRVATAVTMTLEAEAAQIRARFDQASIPHRIVKGAAFAKDLYPDVADRPFTDIDFVLPAQALEMAEPHMRAIGFQPADPTRAESEEKYHEQKWVRAGISHLLIELHTDLVHHPSLRRRVRYGFNELMAPGGSPQDVHVEHVLTSVVHGALGHKFHTLKLAVDVLQAMRRLPEDRIDETVNRAKRLNITYELASSAKLIRTLFPPATNITSVTEFSKLHAMPMMITRDAVTNAFRRDYVSSRVRRHLFRWTQNLRRS